LLSTVFITISFQGFRISSSFSSLDLSSGEAGGEASGDFTNRGLGGFTGDAPGDFSDRGLGETLQRCPLRP
jgi:hypothetical protein